VDEGKEMRSSTVATNGDSKGSIGESLWSAYKRGNGGKNGLCSYPKTSPTV
jgi:hypothetical protein